jgi:hypothetical protein
MPEEEFYCYDHCVPLSPDEDISQCIYCGKELIKKEGYWYTWDADLHSRQKPQEP